MIQMEARHLQVNFWSTFSMLLLASSVPSVLMFADLGHYNLVNLHWDITSYAIQSQSSALH